MKFEELLAELRQDPEFVAAEQEREPCWSIANEVLRLRMAKGWSQSELARRAGTQQANISKLENAVANPTIGFLQKVAQALGTEFMIHFGAEDQAPPQNQATARPGQEPLPRSVYRPAYQPSGVLHDKSEES